METNCYRVHIASPQLHDEGEEHWPTKYHLGCGGVYLDGYVNCDIDGKLAAEHRALMEQNATTINDYYARLDGSPFALPMRRETVCDMICDAVKLNVRRNSVDKIVAVQVFEHLSPVAAFGALDSWHMALRQRHPLIMSVPDMDGTLSMIEGGDYSSIEFALRHLRGRQGDHHQSHHAWYTQDSLVELVQWFGFEVEVLPNFHFYPAIVIKAIKA